MSRENANLGERVIKGALQKLAANMNGGFQWITMKVVSE
jgi:hypothetical protein